VRSSVTLHFRKIRNCKGLEVSLPGFDIAISGFIFATSAEERTIGRLLSECGLPHEDMANHLSFRFEMHHHESEQITMVLEGELFFHVDGKIIGVKEGEVIAIPSAVSHAAFTREKSVKAVDAWSPVMEKYKK
jgi:mannose-6-phosphate isomerase-like protein (cupin superfamily)